MRRRTVLALLSTTPVSLAGCPASGGDGTPTEAGTPTATPEFDASVTYPFGGVVGEPVPVAVAVTNDGDVAGEFEAAVTAGSTDLATGAATVDAGTSTTLTLEPVFTVAGDVDLAVAGSETTLTVYDHELELVDAAMAAVDTLRVEEAVSESGVIDFGEGPTDWERTATITVEKDLAAETLYRISEEDHLYGGEEREETVEEWIVDGVRYERTTRHTEDEVEYRRETTDSPTAGSALHVHGTDTEDFLGYQHTADEYVFVFDPETSTEATALMDHVVGSGGTLPAENAIAGRVEMRYDRVTGRATTYEIDLTVDGADTYPELDRTVTEEHVAYGEPVEVEVPDEVESNAG